MSKLIAKGGNRMDQCHTVFQRKFKESFFVRNAPVTRKLTCTSCGHHGFCAEVAKEEDNHE